MAASSFASALEEAEDTALGDKAAQDNCNQKLQLLNQAKVALEDKEVIHSLILFENL